MRLMLMSTVRLEAPPRSAHPNPPIVIRSSVTRADQMVTDEESDLDEPQVTLTEEVIGLITGFRDCEIFMTHHLLENTPEESPIVLLALSLMFHGSSKPPQTSL